MDSIVGRSAVITGGLTGQGLAIARALAKHGVNVAVGSFLGEARGRVQDAAAYPELAIVEPIVGELSTHGVKVHAAHLDVRENDSIAAFIAEAEAACGPAVILVYDASTTEEKPVSGPPE